MKNLRKRPDKTLAIILYKLVTKLIGYPMRPKVQCSRNHVIIIVGYFNDLLIEMLIMRGK